MREGKELDSAEKVLDPKKVCYPWVTWLKVSVTPGRGVLDTYRDDVVATMDLKDAEAFAWHSTCISGFVYTRFALWFSVRLSG